MSIAEDQKMKTILSSFHNHLRKKIKHSIGLIDSNKLNINLTDIKKKYKHYIQQKMEDLEEAKVNLKNFENSLMILETVDEKLMPFFKSKAFEKRVFTNDGLIRYKELKIRITDLKKANVILSTPIDNLVLDKVYFNIKPNMQKRFFDLSFTDHEGQ